MPLIAYDDEEQVIAWANDSEWGLGALWTSDPERGFAMARRIESGSTFINTHSFGSLDPRMPFGGVKQSGNGREFGTAGLTAYTEDHAIRLLKQQQRCSRARWAPCPPAVSGSSGSRVGPTVRRPSSDHGSS